MCTEKVCSYESIVQLSDGRVIRVPAVCPELAEELAQIIKPQENPGGATEGYDSGNRLVLFFWNEVIGVFPGLQSREAQPEVEAIC